MPSFPASPMRPSALGPLPLRPLPLRSRRDFLRSLFWSAGAVGTPAWLSGCGGSGNSGAGEPGPDGGVVDPPAPRPAPTSRFASIGPLGAADANNLRLPAGFSSRVVAVSNLPPVPGGVTFWHTFPDGGATFARADGGWVYTSNSEVPGVGSLSSSFPELALIPGLDEQVGELGRFVPGLGGVSALAFDAAGNVVANYRILRGSTGNCAGGPTPWNTWLSCEEFDDGRVWECDPFDVEPAVPKPALGFFSHEAVAVDPVDRIVYLTEDDGEGRFYRFVASAADWPAGGRARLEQGVLQVMEVIGDPDTAGTAPLPVRWLDAANPGSRQIDNRIAASTAFRGGEGVWLHEGAGLRIVYFATKGDNRIWALDTAAQTLEIIYDFNTASPADRILSGVDNLTVTRAGDVLVAEDGGDMQLCVILPTRQVLPLVQVVGQDSSEITGPAFSPDGRRLYFSSQRGSRNGAGLGITYEVLMPFAV